MNIETEEKCGLVSLEELSAFVESELDQERREFIESHLSLCVMCKNEVNFQKRLHNTLGGALRPGGENPFPENFARVVKARAESNVDRLRSRDEFRRGLNIFLAIGFLLSPGIFIARAEMMELATITSNQAAAVFSFVSHLTGDISGAIYVALRIFGSQFSASQITSVVFVVSLILAIGILSSRRGLQPTENFKTETQE